MAKDMRTQPTSPNSIPTSQNLDFVTYFFDLYTFFMCFGTQNRFFLMLPEKYLTEVGHRDADWKVSASEIDMNFGLWEKKSKYEVKHLLTTKSWIWGLWVFSDLWYLISGYLNRVVKWGWGNRLPGSGGTGLSDSFDPATNAELNDEGVPANGSGNERYTQIARNGSDYKVVYTVAGNVVKATTLSATYPHPAHFYGLLEVGSLPSRV